ncbi:MAG: hypothetical protein JSS34_02830 [Proteobacteria bacterium]|nr:hypothetical protein [Pseudomonadota bacterium]
MKRLLFLILLFTILHIPSLSFGLSLENLDDYVNTSLKQASPPEFNPDLLPSRIQGNIQIISNLRFRSHLGPLLNPNYPPYSQCTTLSEFPQTALALLLQIFFPSPDDTTLTPNQSSDPVANFTSHQLGQLLNLTETYLLKPKDTQDDLSFRLKTYQILNPKKPLDEKDYQTYLQNDYFSLLLHEFKMVLTTSFEEALPLLLEESQIKEHFGDFPITSLMKRIGLRSLEKDLFAQGILEDNELESYQAALTGTSKTELSMVLSRFKNEKEKTKFKSVRLVEVLLASLKEQILPSTPLPSSVVQRVIFIFFWKKFNPTDSNDFLAQFLHGYTGTPLDVLKKVKMPKTSLSKEEYWGIRNDPESLQTHLSNVPMAAYLSQGYEDYENRIPPFVGYYKTRYKGSVRYSDCCEILFYNTLKVGLKHVPQKEAPLPPTYIFSEDNPLRQILEEDINDGGFSQAQRDDWAARCSNLPNIRYSKSSQGKGQPNDCEVTPGLINGVNVMRAVLNDPHHKDALPFDANEEALCGEINRLCALFRQKGTPFTWTKKEWKYYPSKNDWFGSIVFHIEGVEAFEFVMELGEPGHGYIKRYPNPKDWRKQALLPSHFPPEIVGSYTTSAHLETKLPVFSEQDQINFVHSLDLTALKDQIDLIKYAYSHHPSLIPFAQNLILSIFNNDELPSTGELLEALILLPEHPLLTEVMRQAFKRHPDIINNLDLEYPFNPHQRNSDFPYCSMLLILFQENKMSWIEPFLSSLLESNLNPIGPEIEPFLAFVQTWLPQFTNLQAFHYNNLFPLRDEATTNTCLATLLPVFANLSHLSNLNLAYVPLSSLGNVVEAIPSSLTEFTMDFMDGHTYASEGETQIPVLQEDQWQKLISYLAGFFTKHPSTTFNLITLADFSEADQSRIKMLLTDSGFLSKGLKINFERKLIFLSNPA